MNEDLIEDYRASLADVKSELTGKVSKDRRKFLVRVQEAIERSIRDLEKTHGLETAKPQQK